jgi:hypothetical protein
MCQTTVISSPLAPTLGKLALGVGVGLGLLTGARMLPTPALWGLGALGLTTTWATIATVLLIRRKADIRLQAPAPAPARPRARHSVKVLAIRPPAPPAALPAAETITDAWTVPAADRFEA